MKNIEEILPVMVNAALLRGARKYFEENGYTEILPPHITKATGSCENMDTLFELDYFGKNAYLSQTSQLYLEAFVPELKKVYSVGPSFRAEPRADGRHLTEFTLVELEFDKGFNELLSEIENVIISMVDEVIHDESIDINKNRLKLKKPFKRITYTRAVDELKEFGVKWGDDLKSIHEKYLVEKHGGPIFITHFPREIKFFNMKVNEDDPRIVNSADLILPYSGEAVGAAEREYKVELVVERIKESQMYKQLKKRGGSIKDFEWYLNRLEEGSVPHSGCGIGLSRVSQFVMGYDDIRKSVAFPLNSETIY
ncbi:MAG: hypothetical protein J7L45_02150 [Candidatus Aenigmarchaeota archaeon]|nr:hypothetical protein [Candidatus Aenigmarchaeota archaeon]